VRRITIKDVAREAGVSPQTVSRAINNKGEIRPQTRQRILRIAERLGYRPNSVARSLATKRTRNIGLVVPDVSNPFFAGIARGIQDVAYLADYNTFLCNTDETAGRELRAIQSLEAQRVDGLILCSSRLSEPDLVRISERYQPLVLVNRQIQYYQTGCILVDDATGAYEAAEYLIQLGYRNIGLLAGPESSHSGRARAQGYERALRAHGITPLPRWRTHCSPQVEGGQAAARELFRRAPELEALLAYNDLVAVGALRACTELGRRVPDDCAIVGCDDVPLAALVSPALTTIHVPTYNLGQQAMSLLLDMMSRDPTTDRAPLLEPIVVCPHLVIRDSVGHPARQSHSPS